jgi:hypothetical protein
MGYEIPIDPLAGNSFTPPTMRQGNGRAMEFAVIISTSRSDERSMLHEEGVIKALENAVTINPLKTKLV